MQDDECSPPRNEATPKRAAPAAYDAATSKAEDEDARPDVSALAAVACGGPIPPPVSSVTPSPPPAVPTGAIPAMRRLEARFTRVKSPRHLLSHPPRNAYGRWGHVFAAVDLGTNNCRLLIARPHQTSFKVVDAYSRSVRLGEGLTQSRRLSNEAMARTIEALKICALKIERRGVTQFRAVATEACRSAENGPEFLERARAETGVKFDLISPEEEARLAVESCSSLIERESDNVLVFDIGGGSTELVWLDRRRAKGVGGSNPIGAWTSIPHGVVTLTERFGSGDRPGDDPRAIYQAMVGAVRESLLRFKIPDEVRSSIAQGRAHVVGNSGTVTTIAGVLLGLARYDRTRIDGAWIDFREAAGLARELSARPQAERMAHPCVGPERADLLLPGAAILEAIQSLWPCRRLRVADRGLREGVLLALMARADRRARARRAANRATQIGPSRPQTPTE